MDEKLLLNRYRLQERRGLGGFAAVDVAWDQRLRRRVAIKRVSLNAVSRNAGAQRAGAQRAGVQRAKTKDVPGIEEARTAALLSDAHIVAVYDFELCGNEALIIMENVDGPSLAELMQTSMELLELETIKAILAGVVAALECAHNNRVLHLDIKPANILIDYAGHVKVSDFGLATLSGTAGFSEPQGGTIGYMPPEQITMEPVDERTDLWALAALAYQLITGDNPFFADSPSESLRRIVDEPILLPSMFRPDLDDTVDTILVAALDADKDSRPSSVAKFWKKLAPALGDGKAGRQRLKTLVGQWKEDSKTEPKDNEEQNLDVSKPGVTFYSSRPNDSSLPRAALWNLSLWNLPLRPRGQKTERLKAKRKKRRKPESFLWQRLSPRARGVFTRLVAALGCASMCWLGCSGAAELEFLSGLILPVQVVITFCVALSGFFAPSLGVLLASFVLGAGIIISGQPWAGAIVLAGLILWWILCGRRSPIDATIMSLAPLAAMLGLPFLITLLAGYFLGVRRAIGLALTSCFLLILLSALAPPPTTGMGLGVFLNSELLFCGFELQIGPGTGADGGPPFGLLITAFSNLKIIAVSTAWLVAALLLSLISRGQSRVLLVLAVFLAGITLAAGILVAPVVLEPAQGFLSYAEQSVSLLCSCVFMLVMIAIGVKAQPNERATGQVERRSR